MVADENRDALTHELALVCQRYLQQQSRLIDLSDRGHFACDAQGHPYFAVRLLDDDDEMRFNLERMPPLDGVRHAVIVVHPERSYDLLIAIGDTPAEATFGVHAELVNLVANEVGVVGLQRMLAQTNQGGSNAVLHPFSHGPEGYRRRRRRLQR